MRRSDLSVPRSDLSGSSPGLEVGDPHLREVHLGGDAALAVDARDALRGPAVAVELDDLGFEAEEVAGKHRPLHLGVDAAEEVDDAGLGSGAAFELAGLAH